MSTSWQGTWCDILRSGRGSRQNVGFDVILNGVSGVKKLQNLAAATAIYKAYYSFCRMHGSLNGTPAMAAKPPGHPWSIEGLFEKGFGSGRGIRNMRRSPTEKSGGIFVCAVSVRL
jgi:hypothetical protein